MLKQFNGLWRKLRNKWWLCGCAYDIPSSNYWSQLLKPGWSVLISPKFMPSSAIFMLQLKSLWDHRFNAPLTWLSRLTQSSGASWFRLSNCSSQVRSRSCCCSNCWNCRWYLHAVDMAIAFQDHPDEHIKHVAASKNLQGPKNKQRLVQSSKTCLFSQIIVRICNTQISSTAWKIWMPQKSAHLFGQQHGPLQWSITSPYLDWLWTVEPNFRSYWPVGKTPHLKIL